MIFDGIKAAGKIKKRLKAKVVKERLKSKLVIFLSEDNKAGKSYVDQKKEVAEDLGVEVEIKKPESVDELKKGLRQASEDSGVDGVMVQLPWGNLEGSQLAEVLSLIDIKKDVDGLNPKTLELIRKGRVNYLPATVRAIEKIVDQALLETDKEMNEEFKIAVVGSEGMVGKPLVARLLYFDFEVREFEEGDDLGDLKDYCVVISCTGKDSLIKKEMVQDDFVGIDVGFPEGDFDFERVKGKAGFITPVPGGVGPVTVACLMSNLIEATAG